MERCPLSYFRPKRVTYPHANFTSPLLLRIYVYRPCGAKLNAAAQLRTIVQNKDATPYMSLEQKTSGLHMQTSLAKAVPETLLRTG
jgi:hypothetical protein